MNNNISAIVIGGGYFGCSISYHLVKSGVRTILFEQNEVSSGASGANFGCVQVQDASDGLSLELTLKGFERMKGMEKELNRNIGFGLSGSLITAEKESHLKELELRYKEKKEAGLDIKWIEGKDINDYEPNLKKGYALAATYYLQGRIYPFHYIYSLILRARENGLLLRENTTVKELLIEGGKCTGVILDSNETIRADHVVVSAGSWTKALCEKAGLYVPVHNVKAEAFVTEPIKPYVKNFYSSAGFFAEAHSKDGVAMSLCLTQSHYGNLLVGETAKPDASVKPELNDVTSAEHCSRVKRALLEAFPGLEKLQVLRSWVTKSPFTDSCLPVLGPAPIDGLIIAAGFKSASVMSPMAGEIVTDLITKGKCCYNLSEFISQAKLV